MRITRVEAWPVDMRLAEPYTIAYETVDRVSNVFVRLEIDVGPSGFGCAAPDPAVTGETPEGVLAALRDVAEPILRGADPLRRLVHLETFHKELAASPSARAAVDMALHDLLGKLAGQPMYRILGGFREQILTSVTIGILPCGETVERAVDLVGRASERSSSRAGSTPRRTPSVSCGCARRWGRGSSSASTPTRATRWQASLRFVELTRGAGLELLEQPTPRGEPDLLGRVVESSPMPVMADESLMTLRDAFRLARRDLADMVNVKLMKVGGIDSALQINAVARSARLEVMVGCMDECALGIAAGLHFALARPNVVYADLDGHLGLEGDPTAGGVLLHQGTLRPSPRPGLGCDPRG